MRIRQPLSRSWRLGLGVLSVIVLVTTYGWLAAARQQQKRAYVTTQWEAANAELEQLEAEYAKLPTGERASVTERLEKLREGTARLDRDRKAVVDRTVPTWSQLYRDGLLRVLQPQGLSRNEYWLWTDAKASFMRLFAGLALGVILSVVVGLAMGCYPVVEALLLPPLAFLAQIPPTAMLAVFFVLVGTQFPMFVTMIAVGTLPILSQAIYQSSKKDVPDELIYKADTLGASQLELIVSIILSQIRPRLIDAVRLQIGPAMVLLVAAEWMVAGEGFGYRLRLFFQRTDMTVVFVYLFLLGVFGFVIDRALIELRRRWCPWFGE